MTGTEEEAVGAETETGRGGAGQTLVFILALVLFPLLAAIAFLSSLAALPQLANLQLPPPPATGNNATNVTSFGASSQNASALPPPMSLDLPSFVSALILDTLAILAVVLTVYIVVRAVRNRARELAFTGHVDVLTEESRREVAEILDATAAKLVLGSDYRQSVLRCYKLISEVLEKESRVSGRALTAREFRRIVSEKLKFDSPYLPRATELFEVARYSNEEIVQSQALEAAACLSNLSRSLRRASSEVDGAPPPQQQSGSGIGSRTGEESDGRLLRMNQEGLTPPGRWLPFE